MKTKKLAVFMFILAGVLISPLLPQTASATESIEIKAATWHPVTHRLTDDAYKWYGNEIEKRTKGKVKFKWFLGGSLVGMFKAYDGIKSGLCDLSYIITALNPNEFILTDGINLPFMADSSSHAAAIAWKMYQEIPEMQKEYKKIKPLAFFSTAAVNIHTKKPAPKKIEELKGLKIGTPGPMLIKMIKGLGGSAQQLKGGDIYTALQRGMIDGVFFPDAPLRSYKLTELISHHTILSIGVDVFAVGMNRDKWKSLPPDVQKVFDDIRESAGALFGATLTNESIWVNEELKKRGDEYYYLPDDEKARWKKKLQPIYEGWIERVNKKRL